MQTNSDLTWYAKGVDPVTRTDAWTRIQIRCVLWENRKAANVLASGNLEADQAAIYIPLARGQYAIRPGDVVVRGLVGDEITPGFTVSDLKRKYPDVLTVRSVDRMDYGSAALQHYQVGAA